MALHLALILLVFALILFGSLKLLDRYTHHGEQITVPDLIGMQKEELKTFLESKTLHLVVVDSTFIADKEKGIVLAQNPKPLSKVKMNRSIYVSINAKNPPSVKMPMVNDKSLRQAISVLKNAGLVVGQLNYIPDQCVNCVLRQMIFGKEITHDTVVQKGTVVDLILGGGLSDEKILVPFILNLSREEAIAELKASFLNLGAELYDGSVFDDEDSSNARIFAQHPQYSERSMVYMGSSVDVEYTLLESKIDSLKPTLDSTLITLPIENDSL